MPMPSAACASRRTLLSTMPGARVARQRRPEVVELRERGRVERARGDALDAERAQAPAHLARRLRREGHRHDAAGRVRAGVDAVGDAVRDRRGSCRCRRRRARRPVRAASSTASSCRSSRPCERAVAHPTLAYQSLIRRWAIDARPGSSRSLSPASPAPISARVNQRTATISSPSASAAASSAAVAQEAEHERARVRPRLRPAVADVDDLHAGLLAHLAARPRPRATRPPRRSPRSTRSGCRAHSAFEPSSSRSGSRRARDGDDHGGSVRGKCSRPHDGQCRDQPALRDLGARAARRAERRLEQPPPEAQRLDERAGVASARATRRPRAGAPSRPARRTARPRRARTRRPGAPSPLVVPPEERPLRAVRHLGRRDPVQGVRPPRAARRRRASTSTRVAASARAVLEQTGRRALRRRRGRGRSRASGGGCVLSGAVIEDLSLPLVDKPGVARGRTGAPDLPWAHGTLTPHSSRVRDVGSAPGRRRRSRRSHRRRGRSLRRRGRRTRRRTTRRRARSGRPGCRAPNSPPRRAPCAR